MEEEGRRTSEGLNGPRRAKERRATAKGHMNQAQAYFQLILEKNACAHAFSFVSHTLSLSLALSFSNARSLPSLRPSSSRSLLSLSLSPSCAFTRFSPFFRPKSPPCALCGPPSSFRDRADTDFDLGHRRNALCVGDLDRARRARHRHPPRSSRCALGDRRERDVAARRRAHRSKAHPMAHTLSTSKRHAS